MAGVTISRTAHVAPDVRVDADQAPTDVHARLLREPVVQKAVIESIQTHGAGLTVDELLRSLDRAGLTVLKGRLRSLVVRVAAGESRAVWDLLSVLEGLGRDIAQTGHEAVVSTLPTVLGLGEASLEIAVRIPASFRERRRSQRQTLCRLIAGLAQHIDVVIEAGPIEQRWLSRSHRADIPGVSEACNTGGIDSPTSDRVEQALRTLDAEGRPVAILDALADSETQTLRYGALYSRFSVSKSRVRQAITTLVDLGLVDTFRAADDGAKAAELLTAGETVRAEIPRQRGLEDCVSETPKSATDSRVPRARGSGEDAPAAEAATPADRHRMSDGPVGIAYMSRDRHAAAAGSAPENGVALVDEAIAPQDDRREPAWSYDAPRDELAIGVEADNPLTLTVGLARALASPRTFDRVLDEERLAGLDTPGAVIRDARCIGGWSAEADTDPSVVRDRLLEWREELMDMTRRLRREEYDDRDTLRGGIVRSAHGLAGSMVHLLDLAGVDVVREIRLPRLPTMKASVRADLVETIGRLAAIQSRYGHHAAYRQLFEDRKEKRDAAMNVDVDAADPVGTFIGRLTVVGPNADRLQDGLRDTLAAPTPLHEDAPEFCVHVPLDATAAEERRRYAAVLSRALDAKNLRPTREAVSIVAGLASSPYTAATAVVRGLEPEGQRREIRLDEARTALATLDGDDLLPEQAPTVGDVVATLLSTDAPLSRTELANRAGRSTEAVRTHLNHLLALGLVEDTDAGLSIALPDAEERDDDPAAVLPWWVASDDEAGRRATVDGVCLELLTALDDPPDTALAALGTDRPLDPVGEALPWLPPYLPFIEIMAADRPTAEELPAPPTIRVGPRPTQAPLSTAAAPG